MNATPGGLTPEQWQWLESRLKEFKLSSEQWVFLLVSYGVPASCLTGNATACPICAGDDRFTYDNKRGRGDWVCRRCDNGDPMAGDGLRLICRLNRIGLFKLMRQIDGRSMSSFETVTRSSRSPAPARKRKADPAFVEERLTSMWDRAKPSASGDLLMRYLETRIPGLTAPPPKALRLGMLEYRHEKKVIGTWPGILARFELPDGRLGTLHRTFLERSVPAKAKIVSGDGEILDSKLNDMTLNPLAGGAVRLMDPVDGEIGVGEGLETAYGAHMLFDVPVWNCLNCNLLRQFVVPEGLGIRVVHIFVDFDKVDPKTGKSPGVAAGVELAKRLRADGYTAIIHRPKVRGTDFADEWMQYATSRGAMHVPPVSHLGAMLAAAL
jgi:putative DNA primase/helicase